MKRLIILLVLLFLSIGTTFAQFFVGRHVSALESQINQLTTPSVNIRSAPLEYDALGEFYGHKIQFTNYTDKFALVTKFIVKVDAAGIITECINYTYYDNTNKYILSLMKDEKNRILAKYKTLNPSIKIDDDYTILKFNNFLAIFCTDIYKPSMQYEILNEELKRKDY